MELNPEKDIEIDILDLSKEFRTIGPMIYRYSKEKADLQASIEELEASLTERKAELTLQLRGEKDLKQAEIKSMIDLDKDMKSLSKSVREAKRELETYRGFIDGLKAKRDMLVQLGADSRKD